VEFFNFFTSFLIYGNTGMGTKMFYDRYSSSMDYSNRMTGLMGKGNFNKITYVEYFFGILLCCLFRFARMFHSIAFTMLLWSDYFKGLLIPEHSKNNVADFMHDRPNSHVFLFAFAFIRVIATDDWIYGSLCCLIYFEVVKGHHMQDTPGKA